MFTLLPPQGYSSSWHRVGGPSAITRVNEALMDAVLPLLGGALHCWLPGLWALSAELQESHQVTLPEGTLSGQLPSLQQRCVSVCVCARAHSSCSRDNMSHKSSRRREKLATLGT